MRLSRAMLTLLAAVLWTATVNPVASQESGPALPDSVMGGWKVFVQKQCLQCHAVWGLGGGIGPDLGRTGRQHLTASKLAGTMWNHIPRVYSHMLRNHHEYPRLSQQEMSNLFTFLLFVYYLDEPGDPAAGQRLLREKGCANCHSTDEHRQQVAPDLKRWAGYVNPIVWAQKMWEHAPKMEQAMRQAGMAWPQLDDTDLVNIMAYLSSVGEHEAKIYLLPGSAKTGARLFAERKCQACHHPGGIGKDLAAASMPRSLAALASRMWNHSPEMSRAMQARGVERSPLTAQEMADIVAYILSLHYEDRGGDAQRGRLVFEKKLCAGCHFEQKSAASAAPVLKALGASASPVLLAHVMWNHGIPMMDQMTRTGVSWPIFHPDEMVDLIAYLKSIAPLEKIVSTTPQTSGAPSKISPSPRPPPIQAGASCVSNTCHPGIIAGRVAHAPTAQGECASCHILLNPQTHQMKLLSSTSELCYQCHDEPVAAMHAQGPVAVGVCTACHNPHSADNLFGPNFTGGEVCFTKLIGMTVALETLVGGKQVPQPEPAAMSVVNPPLPRLKQQERGCVTSECHATIVYGKFIHGPTAQQQCVICHIATDEKNHHFKTAAKEPDLCYMCHDRPSPTKFTHGPVALGKCTVCHSPHSAPNKFMLSDAGNELCFTCHTEMSEHVHRARVPHKVVSEKGCLTCHDPHRGNLKFQLRKDLPDLCLECHQSINKTIKTSTVAHAAVTMEKKCVNCHDPHGSNVPKILNAKEKILCLGCHNKPMDTPNGPIIDMKSWIENNPERHGPVRDDNCTGCHQPHGSKNFRILQNAFPREFYRPFSLETYALCFNCHEKTIVLDKRTTTLTDFRNGDKNLHYVHVNQEKGRTCRACHEIHAGTKPKRIKDFVPFGKWKYPVNFEKTESGGRCAPGCHVERAYDRRREITQK